LDAVNLESDHTQDINKTNPDGAETWVLSKTDELHLGVFVRKILRRIYGPTCEDATWR